jgi:hypothetical protein
MFNIVKIPPKAVAINSELLQKLIDAYNGNPQQ